MSRSLLRKTFFSAIAGVLAFTLLLLGDTWISARTTDPVSAQGMTGGRYQSHPIGHSSSVFVLDTEIGHYFVVSPSGPGEYTKVGPFKLVE